MRPHELALLLMLASAGVQAQPPEEYPRERPSPELLEFLAVWTGADGEPIDPAMLQPAVAAQTGDPPHAENKEHPDHD